MLWEYLIMAKFEVASCPCPLCPLRLSVSEQQRRASESGLRAELREEQQIPMRAGVSPAALDWTWIAIMTTGSELSYSNTVLTVYIISGIIFVLLVLSLFIMGLSPITSCCRYRIKKQRNSSNEIMKRVSMKKIDFSCRKCVRNFINLPEEKLDWGAHQIQSRWKLIVWFKYL